MSNKITIFLLLGLAGLVLFQFGIFKNKPQENKTKELVNVASSEKPSSVEKKCLRVELKQPPLNVLLPSKGYAAQTFNNCGPATLSMVLNFLGTSTNQQELGQKIRPYQNPQGDNDDKSVFAEEFVESAKEYGYLALNRPNGTIELLKSLTANGIPVIVRTWLNSKEDIGHFRMVRGYDDSQKLIVVDDSYNGPNISVSYDEFNSLWQPFNYGYILVYPKDKEEVIKSILGDEFEANVAYSNSIKRAELEIEKSEPDFYPRFNLSTAYYHLGDYQKSAAEYDKSKSGLPRRMLWYQLEVLKTLQKVGREEEVLSIIDSVFENQNRGFSELYQLRGEIFLAKGDKELARSEFEKAIFYNKNYQVAKDSLANLEKL